MFETNGVPWGLTRMEPYPAPIAVSGRAVGIDPVTQTARYEDAEGRRMEMGKHGTSTGRETRTRTSQGDGNGPHNMDQGHDQESDQDQGKI